MKKILETVLAVLSIFAYCTAYANGFSQELSDGILRFHILANSDSEYDQQVKLEVRDYVCGRLGECAKEPCSQGYMEKIETLANEKLDMLGAPYDASLRAERVFIPKKSYKNITLPAGRYNAARLVLGSGEGRNWWCVAYPPLCFTEDAAGELSEQGENLLREKMSRETFDMITSEAEYRFWIVDFIGNVMK